MRETIDTLFYTDNGQIVVSCIIGLGIAFMFKRVCADNCTIYRAPLISEIEGKKFKLEDTCYQYSPIIVDCDNKQNILIPYDINDKPDNKIKSFINEN